ncbi:MAG: hypothetical protein IJR28_02765 [Ottowia sp.]|nr:hypothetical protein [Ottowia sp.]
MTQPDQTNDSGAQQPAEAQQSTAEQLQQKAEEVLAAVKPQAASAAAAAQKHLGKAQAWAAGLTKMAPASIRKPWVGALALCAVLALIGILASGLFSGNKYASYTPLQLHEACANDEIGACYQYGHIHFTGKGGVQKDLIKAVKGFRDACDAEHADACLGAGMACQEKVDSYHDIAAKNLMMMGCNYCDFYKKACYLGNDRACSLERRC